MTELPGSSTSTTDTENPTAIKETPGQVAHAWVRRAVRDAVAAAEGDAGFDLRPVYAGDPWPEQVPKALPALRAAVLVRNVATNAWRDAITAARGAGSTWAEIAEIIDIDEKDADGRPLAEAAFELTSGQVERWGQYSAVYWRCSSCQQYITDKGPYESHPRDNETSHAENCARFAGEVAAWQRRYDDDE